MTIALKRKFEKPNPSKINPIERMPFFMAAEKAGLL